LTARALFAALLLMVGAAAGAQETLTLSGALAAAATKSDAAKSSALQLQEASQKTDEVKSAYVPSVDISGGRTMLNNDPFFAFGPFIFPAGEQDYWSYQLTAKYLLWDFGRRKRAVDASLSRETAVDKAGRDAVVKNQLQAADSYLGALLYDSRHEVIALRKKALQDHLRVARDLFDHGVVARNDLLRTEVALRNVEDQDKDADNGATIARQALNRSLGRDPSAPVTLVKELPAAPPLPWDSEGAKKAALERNPSIAALEARVQAAEASVNFERREGAPAFVAEAFHNYSQNRYMLYPYVTGAFVGVSWSLDGGARHARLSQSMTEADLARVALDDARRGVAIQVEQAYRDFQQAEREEQTAETNVKASLENLRIIEDQYKEGIAKTTDVLDAESILADSRYTLAAQRLRAYQKQAQLLALCGEDLAKFYSQLPADLTKEP
jgi:outer membrane protein TolC